METRSLFPQIEKRWMRPGFISLRDAMDRLFDNWFEGFGLEPFRPLEIAEGLYSPRTDVVEGDKEIKVVAELPGLDEKDIELTMNKDRMTLKGAKKEEKEEKEENYYRKERRFGSFCEEIAFPCEVMTDKANAVFKKGILEVTIPKTEKAQKEVKKIAIKSA